MAKILIVDDDSTTLESLKLVLESSDHQVIAASDFESAIDSFQNEEVDVVITDLVMPGKDGFEVIQAIIKENSEAKIIAVSGGVSEEDNTANIILPLAEESGAVHHLKKPYSPDELLEVIAGLFPE